MEVVSEVKMETEIEGRRITSGNRGRKRKRKWNDFSFVLLHDNAVGNACRVRWLWLVLHTCALSSSSFSFYFSLPPLLTPLSAKSLLSLLPPLPRPFLFLLLFLFLIS